MHELCKESSNEKLRKKWHREEENWEQKQIQNNELFLTYVEVIKVAKPLRKHQLIGRRAWRKKLGNTHTLSSKKLLIYSLASKMNKIFGFNLFHRYGVVLLWVHNPSPLSPSLPVWMFVRIRSHYFNVGHRRRPKIIFRFVPLQT